MPIEDFATKQDIEALNTKLSELEKQNQEVMNTLKDLSKNVKDGYIEIRGGEDIPKLSEIQLERKRVMLKMEQYVNFVKTRTSEVEKKLESYGNLEEGVKREAHRQVGPLLKRFMKTEDIQTADELKKNRYAYLTSVLASLGLFISGATICIISILKLL